MQLPLIDVASDWVPPEALPRLSDERRLYVDLETRDPHLLERGPSWAFGDGEITGVAVGTEDAEWYFPVAHEGGGNLDRATVFRWLGDLLADPEREWIAHGAGYEYGWLRASGLKPRGKFLCTAIAAALIDENRYSYQLDALGRDWLGVRKEEGLLRDAARARGWKKEGDVKSNLWRLPSRFVGPYAETDVKLARGLFSLLEPQLKEQDLERVWALETELLPVFIEMRERGVRVDLDATAQLIATWKTIEAEAQSRLPRRLDVWSAASMAKAFDRENLRYPRTALGAPSFTADWLEAQNLPLTRDILIVRRYSKARSTFLESAILGHAHKGRLHFEWHQMKSDEGGTVTGRVSSSKPGAQLFPSPEKNPTFGIPIRRLFLPEEGEQWAAADYSQQEPRWVVHYAAVLRLPGYEEAVSEYREGRADLHARVARMASIPRPKAKIINLGIIYGMGKMKLASELGLSMEDAEDLLEKHTRGAPFIRALAQKCSALASRRGYVRTYLGRRGRFDQWEEREARSRGRAYGYEEAVAKWGKGRIRRAFTHKAMNKVIQGSSADQTKLAMAAVYRETRRAPMLQMHDELDYSSPGEGFNRAMVETMENVVVLEVPSKVDLGLGANWGEAA